MNSTNVFVTGDVRYVGLTNGVWLAELGYQLVRVNVDADLRMDRFRGRYAYDMEEYRLMQGSRLGVGMPCGQAPGWTARGG